jgi:hypothetical protein
MPIDFIENLTNMQILQYAITSLLSGIAMIVSCRLCDTIKNNFAYFTYLYS